MPERHWSEADEKPVYLSIPLSELAPGDTVLWDGEDRSITEIQRLPELHGTHPARVLLNGWRDLWLPSDAGDNWELRVHLHAEFGNNIGATPWRKDD
jgi:hypothetical protein